MGKVRPIQDTPSLPRLMCAAMLALVPLATGCGGKTDKAQKAGAGETVVVEVVRARPVSGGAEIVATGAFRREREIDLSFRIGGVLRQINFREGDRVAAGALVAALDPTQVNAQISQAQAQALQADAGIGQAQEQARAATSSITAAQAGQAQALAAVGQADAQLGSAQAALAQARADAENARRDYERDQALASKGFVTPARLDARKTRLTVADANIAAAQAGVIAAEQTARAARAGVQAAQAGISQAQAGAGAAIAGVRAASGRAQAAQAGVSAAAFDRRWARLVAPAAGIILARNAEPGEITAPGQPIVVLADDTSPLVLRVPVSDRDVMRVRVGDTARVRADATASDLIGQVTRIGERSDPRTGAFDVDIRVGGNAAVKTGFFAQATILGSGEGAPRGGQVLIPAEALIEAKNGAASIFVVGADPNSVKRVRVGFVAFRGDKALVTGLAPNAAVITSGGGYISDNSRISVVERAPS
ncbi:MAG: hypothetical protein RL186_1064 [Pseudomonadota bacterium]